jgi:peroxiredoxin
VVEVIRELHAARESQIRTPEIGETAPDFTLLDTDRQPVSLREIRGSTVILVFFPAAFSSTCTKELCTFRDTAERLNESQAQVLGISVDLPWALREYRKANGFMYPLLSDFDRRVIQAYGIVDRTFQGFTSGVAQRSVFVIDPGGTITWEWVSEAQVEQPDYDQVLQAAAQAHGLPIPR